MVGNDETTIDIAPAPIAAQLHPAGREAQLMAAEATHPRRARGRGWREDQLAGCIRLAPLLSDGVRLQHRYAGLPVDRYAIGDGAMQPGRTIVQRQQFGQYPLCLAQCVAQQDRGLATLFAFAAPRHDPGSHCRRVRPTVDRQREGGFGDEGIAGHDLERRAGWIRLALVVAGRHPDLLPVIDTDLR
ncbi:hypothetical protein G6F35_014163 [Rhizopus arrhizus]|nr:hypothetical protein G6F35_014163 [Rhizopus arrhizus]